MARMADGWRPLAALAVNPGVVLGVYLAFALAWERIAGDGYTLHQLRFEGVHYVIRFMIRDGSALVLSAGVATALIALDWRFGLVAGRFGAVVLVAASAGVGAIGGLLVSADVGAAMIGPALALGAGAAAFALVAGNPSKGVRR